MGALSSDEVMEAGGELFIDGRDRGALNADARVTRTGTEIAALLRKEGVQPQEFANFELAAIRAALDELVANKGTSEERAEDQVLLDSRKPEDLITLARRRLKGANADISPSQRHSTAAPIVLKRAA